MISVDDIKEQILSINKRIDKLEKTNILDKNNDNIYDKHSEIQMNDKLHSAQNKSNRLSTESFTKDDDVSLLNDLLSNHNIVVRKARPSKDELSGIVIINKNNNKKFQVCLRNSGSYDVKNTEWQGFNYLSYDTIFLKKYDAFLFCISDKFKNPHFVVFSRKQFTDFVDQKINLDGYYFYFGKKTNGEYVDARDNLNIKPYVNNFSIFY